MSGTGRVEGQRLAGCSRQAFATQVWAGRLRLCSRCRERNRQYRGEQHCEVTHYLLLKSARSSIFEPNFEIKCKNAVYPGSYLSSAQRHLASQSITYSDFLSNLHRDTLHDSQFSAYQLRAAGDT